MKNNSGNPEMPEALSWLLKQKDVITIVQHNRGEFMGKKIEQLSLGYFMNQYKIFENA